MNGSLAKEYVVKDLGEVKTIMGWQITRDLSTQTMEIDQSAFIRDLITEEGLTECNANVSQRHPNESRVRNRDA